ncbi:MAG: hypothetical protein M1814_006437 [Vezdaea aestivalis]|nr:MAG: hypothetical protein M1814_006437 [Vezdaea aestivalis]
MESHNKDVQPIKPASGSGKRKYSFLDSDNCALIKIPLGPKGDGRNATSLPPLLIQGAAPVSSLAQKKHKSNSVTRSELTSKSGKKVQLYNAVTANEQWNSPAPDRWRPRFPESLGSSQGTDSRSEDVPRICTELCRLPQSGSLTSAERIRSDVRRLSQNVTHSSPERIRSDIRALSLRSAIRFPEADTRPEQPSRHSPEVQSSAMDTDNSPDVQAKNVDTQGSTTTQVSSSAVTSLAKSLFESTSKCIAYLEGMHKDLELVIKRGAEPSSQLLIRLENNVAITQKEALQAHLKACRMIMMTEQ